MQHGSRGSGTIVEVNDVRSLQPKPQGQARFFRARTGWFVWYGVGASAWMFLALVTDGLEVWVRLALALGYALLFLAAWRNGVRVGPGSISIHPTVRGRRAHWDWDLIVGFDHPEARLGGDPARGRLQLLLRDGSAVDLPMVREQAQLVDELSERLGPPRRNHDRGPA